MFPNLSISSFSSTYRTKFKCENDQNKMKLHDKYNYECIRNTVNLSITSWYYKVWVIAICHIQPSKVNNSCVIFVTILGPVGGGGCTSSTSFFGGRGSFSCFIFIDLMGVVKYLSKVLLG